MHLSIFITVSDRQYIFHTGRSTGDIAFQPASVSSFLDSFDATSGLALDISKGVDSLAQLFTF